MNSYITPPTLSTSFSESGKSAKKWFDNILNTKVKEKGLLSFIVILILMVTISILVGCNNSSSILNKDEITNYYSKYAVNNGELKIYDSYKDGTNSYVLAEKYSGDGHHMIDLFIFNNTGKLTYMTKGIRAMSPCYSIYSATLNDKTIIFGDYKNKMWIPSTDKVVDVDLKGIEIKFSDNSIFKYDFKNPETFLIVADKVSDIVEANVYDNEKIVSTLTDTAYSKQQLFDVVALEVIKENFKNNK